VQPHSKALITP